MKVVKIDTTSSALFERLDKAAELTKVSFHAGETMRLAAGQAALDIMSVKDQAERKEFLKVWLAFPGYFACGNNSACRQAREKKQPIEDVADYLDKA